MTKNKAIIIQYNGKIKIKKLNKTNNNTFLYHGNTYVIKPNLIRNNTYIYNEGDFEPLNIDIKMSEIKNDFRVLIRENILSQLLGVLKTDISLVVLMSILTLFLGIIIGFGVSKI
ncbi:MAG: hypothetical protein QW129_05150 [Thermoplasmata archaeon]